MKSKTPLSPFLEPHVISKGSGRNAILFLHGWGGSTKSFETLSDVLIEKTKDTQCVVIDFPGFGKSPMPPIDGWSTHEYSQWLYDFIQSLNIEGKLYLYGHSFGCRVIVRLLNQYPNIADKIILTGAAGIKWPLSAKQRVLQVASKILKPIASVIFKYIPQTGILGKIRRKVLRSFGARDWEECPDSLKPTLTKVLAEPDFRDTLKNIACPTLLLWGAQDTYTPLRSAKIYQENIKNSKLIVYPDGRHGIHYSHTDRIADEVVKFVG